MGSSLKTFSTADEAMQYGVQNFKNAEDGKKILMKLRSGVIKIIRQKKKSQEDAAKEMNNLKLNIYADDKNASCQIGEGGTLLIINIIGNAMDYEWNDLEGIIEELSEKDIKLFSYMAFGG